MIRAQKNNSDDRLNIILVEDDDGDAKAVSRAFSKAGVANPIIRVTDGVEALALLRGESGAPPNRYLLLVDVNMPRMSGIELVRELRADTRLKASVVFIMTTSNDERDKTAAYQENVAGYILKDNAGENLITLTKTFEHFWQLVEMPFIPNPE